MTDQDLPLAQRLDIDLFHRRKLMVCAGCGARSFTGWCSKACMEASWRRLVALVVKP